MSNKRTMFKDFKDSSKNVLFVQTKWYAYKIEKLDKKNYRVISTPQDGACPTSCQYVEYKNLCNNIIGNVKFYEMDSYILD